MSLQKQCGPNYGSKQQGQSNNQNALTHRDLWQLLIDHRSKMDKQLTRILFNLHNQKLKPGKQKTGVCHHSGK